MILPAEILPVTFAYPEILAPVPVIVNTVLPTAAIVTFPFAVAIFTLEFPLLIFEVLPLAIPVN